MQSLELTPQETSTETSGDLRVLRFDFKAVIKKTNGETSKVLIELQKTKKAFNVMRFRHYLGDNYRKEDEVLNHKGLAEKPPLPIVTIYFLGFSLKNIPSSVIKINREYIDVVKREMLDIKEEFVELLTHDSYLIQVQKLGLATRNRLEQVLQIFSPIFQNPTDRHQFNFPGDNNDPLVQRMAERLGRALASEDIRNKMDVEDELERAFDREMSKKEETIAEKEAIIAEKDRLLLAEQKRAEEERQKNLELQRQIEELKRQIKP